MMLQEGLPVAQLRDLDSHSGRDVRLLDNRDGAEFECFDQTQLLPRGASDQRRVGDRVLGRTDADGTGAWAEPVGADRGGGRGARARPAAGVGVAGNGPGRGKIVADRSES
jgi:hypothetical protein